MSEGDAAIRITRARAAQSQWSSMTPAQRVRALRPLRHIITQRMDEIINVISAEVGKPPMDALTGDIMVTLEHLSFYERRASRILRRHKIGKPALLFRGTRFVEVFEPHGIVLICAPWNYPLQLSLVPLATALFAGNAVLLKCSEHTPLTAQLIADLCSAAGLPPNLVQVSCDPPAEATALIDAHPDFIFFTGSNRSGRIVAAKAAIFMIPTVMELGGKDAALVFDSCDLPRTISGLVYGSFSNSGQVCVGTKRIYVQRPIYDEFLRLFLERITPLRIGVTTESDLGPVRIPGIREHLSNQLNDALVRGAKLHTPVYESSPLVLTDVSAEASLLQDESFGPIVCIAPFTTESDAINAANSSKFALSASIWTRDRLQGQRVAHALHSGSCAINDVIRNIGNPHAAIGGNESSGHGRYHGIEGLRTFSRTKSIMTSAHPRSTELHWFPFTSSTFARLRALLQIRHTSGLRNKLNALFGGRS